MAAPLRMKLAPAMGLGTASDAGSRRWLLPLQTALVILLIATLARVALPVPGTPVPITLQDLGVLLVGLFLGPRRGALTVAGYLVVGALGAPVFSNGNAGVLWLLGPTGGYLLAYPLAAFLVGRAAHPMRSLGVASLGTVAAQIVIFTGGGLQLGLLTGQGPTEVFAVAVAPFLPGVVVKTGLLLALCAALASRQARREDPSPLARS